MLYRLIFMFVLPVFSGVLSAQSTDYPPERDPFSGEVQTRLGTFKKGEIPDTLQFQNPRLTFSSMGRFNHWIGVDPNLKSSRFRPYNQKPGLLPSDYLKENLAAVNEAGSDTVGKTQKTNPVTEPLITEKSDRTIANSAAEPNFFERPGVMDTPAAVFSGESAMPPAMVPGEKRWFRDLGSPDQKAGQGKKPTLFQGDAVSAGNELLNNKPLNNGQEPMIPAAFPKNPVPQNNAATVRRFEQKLETMLASNPSVQFLSPIRISYQGGTVTVQGVVPNKTQKIAAGNALLTDPSVKQVNNLITVLPDDPAQAPVPIEPK